MPRFYVRAPLRAKMDFELPENVQRHIQVLRLRVGQELVLFNGNGISYHAELTLLEKRRAECRIIQENVFSCESPLDLHLVQAVSSGERMDFTIQKSVELGVNAIQPVLSERSVVKLAGERAEKRQQRWQEIAISACEQCGRNVVPEIFPLISFKDYLKTIQNQDRLHLLMALNRAQSLREIVPLPKIALMIGAEGGWTQEEEHLALSMGCQAISLGKRVLRTETASLASLAAIQTLWGDF